MNLTLKHYEEITKESGVSKALAENYFYSLTGDDAQYHLIQRAVDKLGAHSQQYVTAGLGRLLDNSEHVKSGGWVCRANGQLKPDEPRQATAKQEDGSYLPVFNKDGSPKLVKYEGIRGEYRGEDVSIISPITEPIKAADGSRLVLVPEGGKKAAAAASLGYEALPLPGVDMGSFKQGLAEPDLIPVLAELVAEGATIAIAFDQDSDKKKRRGVAGSLARLAEQLEQAGAKVIVPVWSPKSGKGLDDILVAKGADFVHSAIANAKPFSEWKASLPKTWFTTKKTPEYKRELERIEKLHAAYLAKPQADITLNQRYLDKGVLPAGGSIVLVDSPMSTGKTSSFLTGIVEQLRREYPEAIAISSAYRNILLRQSGAALDFTHWLETDGDPSLAKFGFLSACPESLPKLAGQSIPSGSLLLVDEVVKWLSHVFCSDTMKNGADRVSVLRAIQTILWKMLDGGGYVIGLEDGIPQWAVACLRELAPAGTPISIVRNEYKFEAKQKAYFHDKLPAFKSEQVAMATKGVKICAASDSATQIDKQYRQMFEPTSSFFISADNSSDDDAQAFATDPQKFLLDRWTKRQILAYVLGYSPTIGAGSSIDDAPGHEPFFDVVTGLFTHLTSGDAAQQLARYRRPVPLHIYCQKQANGIGDSDLSIFDPEGLVSRWRNDADYCHGLVNVADYLKQFSDGDLISTLKKSLDGEQVEVALINKWRSIITAVDNFDKLHLRENLKARLESRGYEIVDVEHVNEPGAAEAFREMKEQADGEAGAEFAELQVPDDMTPDTARDILSTHGHSRQESLQARKLLYQLEFPGCDFDNAEFVTEWLMRNKGKKLSQLRTEWAARNPEAAKAIDRWHIKGKLKQAKRLGTGISAADLTSMSPSADIFARSGMPGAIDVIATETYSNSHPEVVKVAEWVSKNQALLKKVWRMKFEGDRSNLDVFNSMARKLGYQPQVDKTPRKDGKQEKHFILTDFCNPDRGHMLKSLSDKFTAKLEQKGESLDGAAITPAADWGASAEKLEKRQKAKPVAIKPVEVVELYSTDIKGVPSAYYFQEDMRLAQSMTELQAAKAKASDETQALVMKLWDEDGRYQALVAKVKQLQTA